ncbi:hypothetical protein [Longibaculum muris]|uniref:hypothetical protein n=1 Tax=Longibaculum muris TaxID=1796628 RepID=UPI00294257EC|nr:hypothetical protein [Longibaculum muris]
MKNRIPTKEEWVKKINSIVRGKVNYYLNVYKTLEVFMKHIGMSELWDKSFISLACTQHRD